MVLSAKTLFIAGPPDAVDGEEAARRISDPEIQARLAEQSAAFQGEKGASLWAVSAADTSKLAEYDLAAAPVFDGMAACGGRICLSTVDRHVQCFVEKKAVARLRPAPGY